MYRVSLHDHVPKQFSNQTTMNSLIVMTFQKLSRVSRQGITNIYYRLL